ncbi:MAG: T9SS type A sorting domain-containing protein, partial [Bacteroidales bacterium]|nr:T9SS type A sorting domain-containing protein [Bacteroidales bacterium]
FVKEDNGSLLEVIASNDLGSGDLTQWKEVETTGLVDREINNIKPLYPNPVNDLLTIPCTGNHIRVEIHDLKGSRLFSGLLSDKETCQLDVSFLNAGMYLLSVYGGTKVVYKIIKK